MWSRTPSSRTLTSSTWLRQSRKAACVAAHASLPSTSRAVARLWSPRSVPAPAPTCVPASLCAPTPACVPASLCAPTPTCVPASLCAPAPACVPASLCAPAPACVPASLTWTTALSQGIDVTVASVQKLVAANPSTLGQTANTTIANNPERHELMHANKLNEDGSILECITIGQTRLKEHNLSQRDVIKSKLYNYAHRVSETEGSGITMKTILDDCELAEPFQDLLNKLPSKRTFFPDSGSTYREFLARNVDFSNGKAVIKTGPSAGIDLFDTEFQILHTEPFSNAAPSLVKVPQEYGVVEVRFPCPTACLTARVPYAREREFPSLPMCLPTDRPLPAARASSMLRTQTRRRACLSSRR